jgi:hypothetical protein
MSHSSQYTLFQTNELLEGAQSMGGLNYKEIVSYMNIIETDFLPWQLLS